MRHPHRHTHRQTGQADTHHTHRHTHTGTYTVVHTATHPRLSLAFCYPPPRCTCMCLYTGAVAAMRKVIHAFRPKRFAKARAALPPAAARLADQVPDAEQCVLLAPTPLFGHTTTNGVESLNTQFFLERERNLHPQPFWRRVSRVRHHSCDSVPTSFSPCAPPHPLVHAIDIRKVSHS